MPGKTVIKRHGKLRMIDINRKNILLYPSIKLACVNILGLIEVYMLRNFVASSLGGRISG